MIPEHKKNICRLVDTHAHLSDSSFDEDRENVLQAAEEIGIHSIISVSEDYQDALRLLELADMHQMIHPAIGLHPTSNKPHEVDQITELLKKNKEKCAAIGEVGLDYWIAKEEEQREQQREIFGHFITLAHELNLPLNVHSRSAGHYTIDFLLKNQANRVQLHAYDGKASKTLPAIEAGYFFSIPPSIVYSPQKQKLVKKLPLSSLLLETDSPVLGPTRGIRNTPSNLSIALDTIATIKQLPKEKIAEAIYENTYNLYQIEL